MQLQLPFLPHEGTMEDYILEEEEEEEECIVLVKPPSPSVLISLLGRSGGEVEN